MVVIDIDMPKDCSYCPFKKNYRTNDYGCHCECEWDDEYRTINLLEYSKPKWCPLKEAPSIEDIKVEIRTMFAEYGDGTGVMQMRNQTLNEVLKVIDKHISGKENE